MFGQKFPIIATAILICLYFSVLLTNKILSASVKNMIIGITSAFNNQHSYLITLFYHQTQKIGTKVLQYFGKCWFAARLSRDQSSSDRGCRWGADRLCIALLRVLFENCKDERAT